MGTDSTTYGMTDPVMFALAVPPGTEVTFRGSQNGSFQITLTPAASAAQSAPDADYEQAQEEGRRRRAAAVARRRPASRGNRGQPGGQAWHTSRDRNAAIRAFADADPRFSRRDYRSPGPPGGREGYYISKPLRSGWDALADAERAEYVKLARERA